MPLWQHTKTTETTLQDTPHIAWHRRALFVVMGVYYFQGDTNNTPCSKGACQRRSRSLSLQLREPCVCTAMSDRCRRTVPYSSL